VIFTQPDGGCDFIQFGLALRVGFDVLDRPLDDLEMVRELGCGFHVKLISFLQGIVLVVPRESHPILAQFAGIT